MLSGGSSVTKTPQWLQAEGKRTVEPDVAAGPRYGQPRITIFWLAHLAHPTRRTENTRHPRLLATITIAAPRALATELLRMASVTSAAQLNQLEGNRVNRGVCHADQGAVHSGTALCEVMHETCREPVVK